MKKRYFVIIGFVVICLLLGVVYWIGYEKNKEVHKEVRKDVPTESLEDIWPRNGKVIATIDGREYRYDPIYLYRLTSLAWKNNPNRIADKGITYLIEGERLGALDSLTLKDNAVHYELLYLESLSYAADIEELSATTNTQMDYDAEQDMEKEKNVYNEILSFFPSLGRMKVVTAHENAKYYEGQSDKNYWRQVQPYHEKFFAIRKMELDYSHQSDAYPKNADSMSLNQREEAYYQALKEKYNVVIME